MSLDPIVARYVAISREEGWTHSQVIDAIVARMKQDEAYTARRQQRRNGGKTPTDTMIERDLRALALAVTWLSELPL